MSGSTIVFDTAEGELDEIAGRIREVSAIMPQLVMEIIKSPQDTPQLAEGRNASFSGLFFHEDAPQLAGG